MQRINRADPVSRAAAQRLSIALILSLLVHVAFAWALPGSGGGPDLPDLLARAFSPPVFAFSATLVPDASVFKVSTRERSRDEKTTDVAGRSDTPDPHYYAAEELDVLPTPRAPIRLGRDTGSLETGALGTRSSGTGSTGTVRLLARIDASGRIIGLSAWGSDTAEQHNAAALHALGNTSFNAGRKDGRPVRSEVVIEVTGRPGN